MRNREIKWKSIESFEKIIMWKKGSWFCISVIYENKDYCFTEDLLVCKLCKRCWIKIWPPNKKNGCTGGTLFLSECHSSAFLNMKAEFGCDETVRNRLSILSWMILLREALNTNNMSWTLRIFWGLSVWAQSNYSSEAYGFSLHCTCEQLEVMNTNMVYAKVYWHT